MLHCAQTVIATSSKRKVPMQLASDGGVKIVATESQLRGKITKKGHKFHDKYARMQISTSKDLPKKLLIIGA